MQFNRHYNLTGKHAFFTPSSSAWLRYDDAKLAERMVTWAAAKRGTEMHALAAEAIRLGVEFKGRTTIARFVNEAIGFGMSPEQLLYYSDNIFGTADAIGFKRKTLRVFDLKTGVTPAHVEQLEVYSALFCLEYGVDPYDTTFDLRIFQSDDVAEYVGDPQTIFEIMQRIKYLDNKYNELRREELV